MREKKRHVNIPVFIPHLGCPNMCVFCNQRSISGVREFDCESVISDIETVLSTLDRDGTYVELAFFGGSFTGIDRELMIRLLEIGKRYLDSGIIDSMRCSTRPDYIDPQILDILSRYGMRTVELGIQSMDDGVLTTCRRGHNCDTTRDACRAVVDAGLELVGQMMIGLPGATPETEAETARFICSCGAAGARVYPTVVFYETELCDMSASGAYIPLSTEQAIERTKNVLGIFDENDIKVIRVGLCSSENLTDESKVYAGASDESIGEKAMSALYLDRIEGELCRFADTNDKCCMIEGSVGSVSKISGHKRKNKIILQEKYGFKSVKILENENLLGYNIKIDVY